MPITVKDAAAVNAIVATSARARRLISFLLRQYGDAAMCVVETPSRRPSELDRPATPGARTQQHMYQILVGGVTNALHRSEGWSSHRREGWPG